MGKKRSAIIGSPEELDLKAKHAVKLEQKKLREGRPALAGKTAKVPGLGGGQRVADSTEESLREYAEIQKRQAAVSPSSPTSPTEVPGTKAAKAPRIRSQAYTAAKSQVDPVKLYPTSEAIELLRKVSYSKTNDTVELHLVLKNRPASDPKVSLPHSTGKSRKIAVFSDAVLKQIDSGKIDFDVLVASPADMPKLVKYAKVLGPRGLMPNPKSGTISDKPQDAASKLAADTLTTLKIDKSAPVIHTTVGKLSLKDNQLSENISAILAIAAPTGLRKVVLKSTMSPAIKLVV